MKKMIGFYNEQRKLIENERKKKRKISIDDCLDTNPQKISWTRSLRNDVDNNIVHKCKNEEIVLSFYRPFIKEHLYYDKPFIESPGIWSQLFIKDHYENIAICLTGIGTTKDFTMLMVNHLPCLDIVEKSQCFPLYWYEKKDKVSNNLFEKADNDFIRHDAISDFILEQAKSRYGGRVTKEDIFYYVYGILHSPDYRKTFANDLKKMLPRLPLVEKTADFWAFSKTGRELADLHLNYEDQPSPNEVLINSKPIEKVESGKWKVDGEISERSALPPR
jgi:predicted helicase